MEIGYVVLYMKDTNKAAKFWVDTFNFVIKDENIIGDNKVITVGSKDAITNFELVPLALMKDNPYNLNLAIPSICLKTDSIENEYKKLKKKKMNITEIGNHGGKKSFSIIDFEGNAFAISE